MSQTYFTVKGLLRAFLEDIFRQDVQQLPSNQCSVCSKTYKNYSRLKTHLLKKHNIEAEQPMATSCIDVVAGHARQLIKVLLLKRHLDQAISHGDGEGVFLTIKFLMLYFKALGHTNYAVACFEMIGQVNIMCSEKMRTAIIHERFVNNHGGLDRNVPMDQDCEFQNKAFKQAFNIMNAEPSQTYLNRLSKSVDKSCKVVENFMKELNIKVHHSRRHYSEDKYNSDVNKLIKVLQEQKVFSVIEGRTTSSEFFQSASIDPVLILDMYQVKQWMVSRMEDMIDQPYYSY